MEYRSSWKGGRDPKEKNLLSREQMQIENSQLKSNLSKISFQIEEEKQKVLIEAKKEQDKLKTQLAFQVFSSNMR